jgi:hypothetical protein
MYPIVAREPLRCRWVVRIVTPNKCDGGTQIWTKTRSVNGYVQVNEGSPVNLSGGSLRIKGQKGSEFDRGRVRGAYQRVRAPGPMTCPGALNHVRSPLPVPPISLL